MVATVHVNQRVRLPNEVKVTWASYLTEKLAKCGITSMHHTSYMPGNIRRKANIYASENGMTKIRYFSAEKLPVVNPVVMNYKIRHQ